MSLSTATSIDALAVGLGLAALRISVWYPSAIIGTITLIMSAITILVGKKGARWLGANAQIAGGINLLLIACKIVAAHLL